jgi:hypothetical protein
LKDEKCDCSHCNGKCHHEEVDFDLRKAIQEAVDDNAIGQLYVHLELRDLGRAIHKILDSDRGYERYHIAEVELQRRIQLMLTRTILRFEL